MMPLPKVPYWPYRIGHDQKHNEGEGERQPRQVVRDHDGGRAEHAVDQGKYARDDRHGSQWNALLADELSDHSEYRDGQCTKEGNYSQVCQCAFSFRSLRTCSLCLRIY